MDSKENDIQTVQNQTASATTANAEKAVPDKKPVNKSPEIYVAWDLEMNQPSNRIIQIGAVVGNIKTGEIFEEFSRYVKSEDDPISEFITKLTGITDEMCANEGVFLYEAYKELSALQQRHGAFINGVNWGDDRTSLYNQLKGQLQPKEWTFGGRHEDAKACYRMIATARDLPFRGGLAKSMTRFGLKFSGTKHSAKDDAKNTLLIYSHMMNSLKK